VMFDFEGRVLARVTDARRESETQA
jgi:hypothetical protein